MQQQGRFNPYHLIYDKLGEEIESYRRSEHISIRTLAYDARMNHHTYNGLRTGTDFKLNYYLRLVYAFSINSEKEHFLAFLKRLMRIAIQEICGILKTEMEWWMREEL